MDSAVLLKLADDLGAAHVAELCELFVADARARVQAIRSAGAAGDTAGAARAAHVLKSASGFLGAVRVADRCREIEILAADERFDQLGRRADVLAAEVEEASRVLAAMVDEIASLGSVGPP